MEKGSGEGETGGRRITDDIPLSPDFKEEMKILSIMKKESEVLGLQLNLSKTKLRLPTALHEFEEVGSFVYPSSAIEKNEGSTLEIRRQIILTEETLTKLTKEEPNYFKEGKVEIPPDTRLSGIFVCGINLGREYQSL